MTTQQQKDFLENLEHQREEKTDNLVVLTGEIKETAEEAGEGVKQVGKNLNELGDHVNKTDENIKKVKGKEDEVLLLLGEEEKQNKSLHPLKRHFNGTDKRNLSIIAVMCLIIIVLIIVAILF